MAHRAAFLLCCLAAAAAQDRPFRVQTRIVQIPAVITNKSGYSIDGLRARDFTVLDNGVRKKSTSTISLLASRPSPWSSRFNPPPSQSSHSRRFDASRA